MSDLETAVQEGFNALGIDVQVNPDASLAHYRKGQRVLREGELKDGLIVWCYYRKGDEQEPRIDGAYRIKKDPQGNWLLEDGSSFCAEYQVNGNPEEPCINYYEGPLNLFEAIS